MASISKPLSLAVVCPGQGIITRGCLSGLRLHQRIFQSTLDCLDSVFDTKVSSILLSDPIKTPDKWSLSTSNAQPAILASTYAMVQIMRHIHGIDFTNDPRISYYLGHSLGEYTALLLSGVLSLTQALKVVRRRGILMERLVGNGSYEMRVLVFKPANYIRIYDTAVKHGVLACANNSTQISVSGSPKSLDSLYKEVNSVAKTVLRQVKLPVTIPFHNQILQKIEPDLKALVSDTKPALKPVISNVTGKVSSGDLFENTVKCNSEPVQWKKSMEFLESSVTGVISLGPGNSVDAINSKFRLKNYGLKTTEDMHKLAQVLKESE